MQPWHLLLQKGKCKMRDVLWSRVCVCLSVLCLNKAVLVHRSLGADDP